MRGLIIGGLVLSVLIIAWLWPARLIVIPVVIGAWIGILIAALGGGGSSLTEDERRRVQIMADYYDHHSDE